MIARSLFTLALLCTTGLAMAGPKRHVYFGTGGKTSQGIYRATFDSEKGKLTPSELAAEIGSPGFLTLYKDRLYSVGRWENNNGVIGYHIGEDGGLTEFTRMKNPDGGGCHIEVHPSGKFLLTAQYGGGSTALFPLDADGQLGEPSIHEHQGGSGVVPKRQEGPHPHWVGFSPDGQYALVPDLGLDQIVIYKVDTAKPAIAPHGVAQGIPGGGPRHMRFSVDGRFIYLLNELTLSVTTFAWEAATGTTKQLTTTPAISEAVKAGESFNSAAEILVHPSGDYVYSSNRGHDTVTVYRANQETGELSVVQVQPVRGAFPRNINLDPTGTWLLAAGADSNTIAAHSIDPDTGKLTYQRGAIINVPGPICIKFGE